MNNYITQGTTITVQTAVLKETINNDKNALNNEKELMKQMLIDCIEELDIDKLITEEERANCIYLTCRIKTE